MLILLEAHVVEYDRVQAQAAVDGGVIYQHCYEPCHDWVGQVVGLEHLDLGSWSSILQLAQNFIPDHGGLDEGDLEWGAEQPDPMVEDSRSD
jgi:hypothetical protein